MGVGLSLSFTPCRRCDWSGSDAKKRRCPLDSTTANNVDTHIHISAASLYFKVSHAF